MTVLVKVPKDYSDIYFEKGVSLESAGVNDRAFVPEDALSVLNILRDAGVPVVGGEVWKIDGDKLRMTNDIWEVDRSGCLDEYAYLQKSLSLAEKQTRKYILDGDFLILFSI